MSRLVNLTNFERRARRVRAKVSGTKEIPRLSVFRSNKFIYAQLIDDDASKTLASFSAKDAKEVGSGIAKKAITLGLSKAVFDKGGYLYTGKIKLVADSAREAGLKF